MIALGAFETNSVAAGMICTDEAMKASDISIIESGAVCAGKYITIFDGSAASVKAALSVASFSIPSELFWVELYIGKIHPSLLKALSGVGLPVSESLGLYESYSVIQAIEAADQIMKRSNISIVDIRLGRGLGGKSVVTFTGSLPEVKDSCSYLEGSMLPKGCISDVCILENPHEKAVAALENSFFISPNCLKSGGLS